MIRMPYCTDGAHARKPGETEFSYRSIVAWMERSTIQVNKSRIAALRTSIQATNRDHGATRRDHLSCLRISDYFLFHGTTIALPSITPPREVHPRSAPHPQARLPPRTSFPPPGNRGQTPNLAPPSSGPR